MKKINLLILIFFSLNFSYSQEIKSKIIVNSESINQTNSSVFKNLEITLSNFVNNSSWSNINYSEFEKVNLNMNKNVQKNAKKADSIYEQGVKKTFLALKELNSSIELIEQAVKLAKTALNEGEEIEKFNSTLLNVNMNTKVKVKM